MIEKHNALWIDSNDDDSAKIVREIYSAELDKLFVIYERKDGRYMPFSCVKTDGSPQWSLPFWSHENTKVLTASLEEAENYLVSYGAKK